MAPEHGMARLLLLLPVSCSAGLGRQEAIPLPQHTSEAEARFSTFPSFLPQESPNHFQSLFHSLRAWVPRDSRYVKVAPTL